MKKTFIVLPIILFILLIMGAYFINITFIQSLFFCIASAILGVIATFVVVDEYYKRKDIDSNKLLFLSLMLQYKFMTSAFYNFIAEFIHVEGYEF